MVIVLFDKFRMQETFHKMHLGIMSPKEILSFVTIVAPNRFLGPITSGTLWDKVLSDGISSEWYTSNKCRVAKAQTCFNIYSFLRICKFENMIY